LQNIRTSVRQLENDKFFLLNIFTDWQKYSRISERRVFITDSRIFRAMSCKAYLGIANSHVGIKSNVNVVVLRGRQPSAEG